MKQSSSAPLLGPTEKTPLSSKSKYDLSLISPSKGNTEEKCNAEFTPVIALPDLVEVTTGEEGEEQIFVERSKLFRMGDGEWKERGVGELKILRNPQSGAYRLIMRRDQVLKLAANHHLCSGMKITALNEKSRMWAAKDFSEGELKNETLFARFKTAEIAQRFEECFIKAVSSSRMTPTHSGGKSEDRGIPAPAHHEAAPSKSTVAELFKPKGSEWICSGCAVKNKREVHSCPCCNTSKPGTDDDKSSKEVTTGEEGEEQMFVEWSKLFRMGDGEWKERGVGELKILRNPQSGAYRLIMRRDQVLKLAANHHLCSGMKITAVRKLVHTISPYVGIVLLAFIVDYVHHKSMASTKQRGYVEKLHEKSRMWAANDFSKGELKNETLFARFKTAEIAQLFEECFTKAVSSSRTTPTHSGGNSGDSGILASAHHEAAPSKSTLAELFKPKGSEWICSGFAVKNKGEVHSCPCCNTSKPGTDGDKLSKEQSSSDTQIAFLQQQLAAVTAMLEMSLQHLSIRPPAYPTSFSGYGKLTRGTSPVFQAELLPKNLQLGTYPHLQKQSTTPSRAQPSKPVLTQQEMQAAAVAAAEHGYNDREYYIDDGGDDYYEDDYSENGYETGYVGAEGYSTTAYMLETSASSRPMLQPRFFGQPEKTHPKLAELKPAEPGVPSNVLIGEEDEERIFCNRAKLYKFDPVINEWKERGVGELKLLKHAENGTVRILLRREQVFKLVCNHLIQPSIKLLPMTTSETAWCWFAKDYADTSIEDGPVERIAVRFKNIAIATEFKQKFEESQEFVRRAQESRADLPAVDTVSKVETPITPSLLERPTGQVNVEDEEEKVEDDDADENDDEDDEDLSSDEDEIKVLYERQVTLYERQGSSYQSLGIKMIQVVEENVDIIRGMAVYVLSDDDIDYRQLIFQETPMATVEKKTCSWHMYDFLTERPHLKYLQARFASSAAAKDFSKYITQGIAYAKTMQLKEAEAIHASMATNPIELNLSADGASGLTPK
ncbi:E3 SUMO-protein ligase RanBP2-like [Watersipora subatra]|uniref:E3 SUMO-protein ligase RanBP2-like n=1 Tax=Watersipora subatra TaxID=2589382 RepID=UPI00355C88F0